MKKLLIALGVVAVLVVIVVASLGRKKASGQTVYAAQAAEGDIVSVVQGNGVIQPRTKVNISSEIYGQIVEIAVKEGQVVKKGALLVRIDPEKYRSEVDRLSANVRVSRIAIESEEITLKNLERELKRAEQLHAQGILSSTDRERAELAVDSSRSQLKSLKESVTQAEAALKRSNDDLGKATIFAPMAGKVTQVNTEVGEQVIVGTTNIPGSVMLVISDMGEVLAEVSVDETEIAQLTPGQKAVVTVDAIEKTPYEGVVHEIRNTARREGEVNVFGVKLLLKNPDERLRPGMTAKAKIEVERKQNVLRVPMQAVTTRERKKLEEDRKLAGAKGSSSSGSVVAAKNSPGSGGVVKAEKASSGSSGGSGSAQGGTGGGNEAPVKGSGRQAAAGLAGEDAKGAGEKPVAKDGGPGKSEAADRKAGKAKDEREEIQVVYIVEKDIVRAVPVTTGSSEESYVEIREGLEGGETVVTGPYRVLKKLKDGDRVIAKSEREAAEEAEEKSSEAGD